MNKIHINTGILLLVLIFISQSSFGKIVRVNNGRARADGAFVYKSLKEGYAMVSPGDTLHIEGASKSYGSFVLTKENITIIGPGYFLDINDSTQASTQAAKLDTLVFGYGCDNTIVYGLSIVRTVIKSNNVHLSHCRVVCDTTSSAVHIDTTGLHDIFIEKNYIHQTMGNGTEHACIYVAENCDDLVIRNNIIRKHNNNSDATAVYAMSNFGDITFKNNVVFGSLHLYTDAAILNNILGYGNYAHGVSLNLVFNNISNSNQFGLANGNLANVDMATVLNLSPNINQDEYYGLCAGSAAIGAGLRSENCGAYRKYAPTAESYIKSGLAPVPAIFKDSVENTGDKRTELEVFIHAMSHH